MENVRRGAIEFSILMALGLAWWSLTVKPNTESDQETMPSDMYESNGTMFSLYEIMPNPSDSTIIYNEMEISRDTLVLTLRDSTDVVQRNSGKWAKVEDIEVRVNEILTKTYNRSKDTTEDARMKFNACDSMYNSMMRTFAHFDSSQSPPQRASLLNQYRI